MSIQQAVAAKTCLHRRFHHVANRLSLLLLVGGLTACGGGTSDHARQDGTPVAGFSPQSVGTGSADTLSAAGTGLMRGASANSDAGANPVGASRLLAQGSFGATDAEINYATRYGYGAWVDRQFTLPQTSHVSYMNGLKARLPAGTSLNQGHFLESFWKQAVTGEDQLRQRVAFGLSQIFVVSFVDGAVFNYPRGVASYYDMLGTHAFGNFRDLLEAVTLHPMMGLYLGTWRNEKESGTRIPDQNYARELMQLFTIGLYELNPDGTRKLVDGRPVESYTNEDIVGLSRVLTGWGFAGPDKSDHRFHGGNPWVDRDIAPMQQYPKFHSSLEKSFLGLHLAGGSSGEADLKAALDRLFVHPNTAPFFSRLLIQRLVTSNPSPAYIARVASVFADNGKGVRGDMKAVIRAILLDPVARQSGDTTMRVREPVLRYANWMRTFNAKSTSGRFLVGVTDDVTTSIGQTAMRSPSVFNFYRPNYVPSNSASARVGLAAPEMQIVSDASVVGYLNTMRDVIANGAGAGRDLVPDYRAELALAGEPSALVDRLDRLLTGQRLSPAIRNRIIAAANAIPVPAATATNAMAVEAARMNRVRLAIFLVMASPEYLVQK